MPGKHCAYGLCTNNSRYVGLRPELENVVWYPFPKPNSTKKPGQKEKAQRWIKAIGRKGFTADHITKDIYVCSKHFKGGNGPTLQYPDPIPCATAFERSYWEKTSKHRKPPKDRTSKPASEPDIVSGHINTKSSPVPTSEGDTPCQSDTSVDVNVQHPPMVPHRPDTHRSTAVPGGLHNQPEPVIPNGLHVHCPPVTPSELDSQSSPPYLENTKSISGITHQPASSSNDLLQGDNSKGSDAQSNSQQKVPLYIVRVAVPAVPKETRTIDTQTDVNLEDIGFATNEELKSEKKLNRKLFVRRVTKDDASCKFYTGLTLSTLAIVLGLVEDKASRLNYWKGGRTKETGQPNRGPSRELSIFQQFLLSLVRLRRGIDHRQLADLFGTSTTTVSRTFTTWINFLALELKFLVRWPTKEQVLRKLPSAFKPFLKTRALIDCTEIFIQRPKRTVAQKKTWSSYKHHNTFKALLATTPRGVFSFVSELWTGNTSDKKITEASGFTDNVEHGDDIMADRGFLIRDLLAVKGATLNIPPFAHGRQMTANQTTRTRRIARARIHVERAIGRLKNFRVLSGVMPLHLKDIANQILQVCAGLCNLDKVLVKCHKRRAEM